MKTMTDFLFENSLVTDIEKHLKERGVDLTKTRVITDPKTNLCSFFIYNLSGQLIGFQRYNPNGVKTFHKNEPDNLYQRYYTYVTKEGKTSSVVAYGLESYIINSKFIFITEGIFDCIKIHNAKQPAIALLKNDPEKATVQWLKTLPQIKIVITDDDKAGLKLSKVSDYYFITPKPYKDLGEMPQTEVNSFIKSIIDKLHG